MVEMPLFGERATISESALSKALIWRGKTLMGQMLSELTGAVGYLAARGDVDPQRIASYGISLGCTLAFMLAALDARIKCTAHLCCYADYDVLIDLGAHDRHGAYLTIPGMLTQDLRGQDRGGDRAASAIDLHRRGRRPHPARRGGQGVRRNRGCIRRRERPRQAGDFHRAGRRPRETPAMRAKVMRFLAETL